MLSLLALFLLAQNAPLDRGIQAYKNARYPEALQAFQEAVNLNPNDIRPHLYLGTTWMSLYIPGAQSPENLDHARNAEGEFNRVWQLDPRNEVALASLGSLAFQQAGPLQDPDQKARKLDEAASWYQRLAGVNPANKEAYYTLGVIAWSKFYPVLSAARAQLGMRPETPGPLPNPIVRQDLRSRFGTVIEDGISSLEKALALDAAYDDAMAYMNLLLRERGDLRDSTQEYMQDIAAADDWVRKTLETKKTKSGALQGGYRVAPPPPPPPGRIRVGAAVQENLLVQKVDPVYPPLARQARIQGTVRMNVVIGKGGRVENIQLASGHPLLAPSAMEAVGQWVYKPTLLNGQPVEVITSVDLNFRLD